MPDIQTGLKSGMALLGGKKSAKQSNQMSAEARAAYGQVKGIGDKQAAFADAEMERYDTSFRPIEDQIVTEAQAGPDYEGAMGRSNADVAQSFDKAQGINERNMQRYGIDPSSGRYGAQRDQYATNRALAEVGGRNQARAQEDDKSWARRLTALDIGKGNRGDAINAMGSAAGNYQNYATGMQSQANQAANSASKGVQTFGGQLDKIGSWAADTMTSNSNSGYSDETNPNYVDEINAEAAASYSY